ncbi:hypothetical protein [Corynebacterium guangdongense]|uniref:hypothetical protein n=1 Tax=Corynebacterium guangdongense TaxID=1783348 RepID=UPI0025B4C979|nr:hypothetical protein [Corynebacterium guangdongense]
MSPSKLRTARADDAVTDALHSDAKALENNVGPAGRVLIKALDRAVGMQTSLITNYVARLRRRHPEESPAQLQRRIDRHFMRLSTASGAGVGATAAVPGVGFIAATAAVGAESLVFLDAAAFHTMASAHLRGADVSDPERRRALILVVLLGAKGSAIVDTFVGEAAAKDQAAKLPTTQLLNRFSLPTLASLNSRLLRSAVKRISRRLTRGWLGKIMPLGIGAIAGTLANRKLAGDLISNTAVSLGAPPAQFLTSMAELPEVPEDQAEAIDALDEDADSDSDADAATEVGEDRDEAPRWKFWDRDAKDSD